MSFLRIGMVILMVAGVYGVPAVVSAKDSDKEKKPKVSELLKDANEMMTQAQAAYVDGQSKQAIELYRKALSEITRVERENQSQASSSEFAPVRFRKAICETEVDRIMLEDVNATARTVAVTDTSALELKRAERKKAAETNNMPEATVKLTSKQGADKGKPDGSVVIDEEIIPQDAVQDAAAKAAKPDKPVRIAEELEWAKDMISVDRFEDAEKALVKVLKQAPDNRDARFLMGLSRVQQGRHQDAIIVIDDLLADKPDDVPAQLLAAGAYVAAGSYAKAMDALDKAMKADPKRPDGYHNMAWLLLEMNPKESGEAEMYYRQAVKLGGTRDRDIERRLGIKAE